MGNNTESIIFIFMADNIDLSRLTELTHDEETSKRLYYKYRQKFPDQSQQWAIEKAIEDLLRDRGVPQGKRKRQQRTSRGNSTQNSSPKSFVRGATTPLKMPSWASRQRTKSTPSAPAGQVDISPITEWTKDRNRSIRLYRKYSKKYKGHAPDWIVAQVVSDILIFKYEQRQRQEWLNDPKTAKILSALVFAIFVIVSLTRNANLGDRNYTDFPPPTPYQAIESGGAVSIKNRSPEMMVIRLDGATDYQFRIEPCLDCGFMTEAEGARACESPGPELTFNVAPGEYEARINFVGVTRGFRSQWLISDRWLHGQCIFTVPDF